MKIDTKNGEIVIFDFNREEAYRLALNLEKESITFYENILKKVDKENAVIVNRLLDEETKHYDLFLSMTEKDVDEEHILDFVSSGVLKLEVTDNLSDINEIIDIGKKIESRSILFYKSLLKNETDIKGREIILNLISEEKKHLYMLENL